MSVIFEPEGIERHVFEREIRPSFMDWDVWDEPTIYTTETPTWRDIWKIATGRYEPQVVRLHSLHTSDEVVFLNNTSGGMSLPKREEGDHPAHVAIKEGIAEEPITRSKREYDDIDLEVRIMSDSDK